jgi:hypothetical protein
MSSVATSPVIYKKRKWAKPVGVSGFAVLQRRQQEEPQECAFECFVRENQIPEILWDQSIAVREWAKKNAHRRYVPEHVLNAFHIEVKISMLGIYSGKAL